jgi:hypothetical protein
LRNLNRIVATLRQYGGCCEGVSFRMADFATFALMVARSEGREAEARRILEQLDSRRGEMLLSEEPIAICLEKWLETPANNGRTVTSAELNRELSWSAGLLRINWPYPNPHSLGQRLSHIAGALGQRFDMQCDQDSAKRNLYRFARKPESLKRSETQIDELQVD